MQANTGAAGGYVRAVTASEAQRPAEQRATVAVAGASLRVVEVGEGAPLLVAHGGPGEAHDVLRPHLDALARDGRRLVYWDQRGGGASALDPGTSPGGWREHVADAEAVRRHLAAERVDLLGFSWGALLALLYALEHPARVGRLVLVSVPALASEGPGPARSVEAPADDPASLRARFVARVAPALFDPSRALALTPVEAHPAVADAAWRSLGRFDLRPRLSALRGVPTLVVQGADDPLGSAGADAVVAAVGASRLTLARCGHAPFVEAPEVFAGCVGGFLGG